MISPWVVVGDPTNRRVTLFVAAAEGLGVPVDVVSWNEVLDDVAVLERPGPFTLRLESFGEDDALADRLRARGFDAVGGLGCERTRRPGRPGELLAPSQTHAGFLSVLDAIDAWSVTRPDVDVQQPTIVLRTCFDKRICHGVLAAAGLPVPEQVPAYSVDGVLGAARSGPVWVKLSCGSSGSGIGVLRQGGKVLMTTVRTTNDGRFNSFRVQRLTGDDRDATLSWLLSEGVQVEREVRRPRLEGAFFDLRVLVIDGEPRFMVVRCARHPITNLHLGGWRGAPDALWSKLGEAGRQTLLDVCRRVGRALPAGHLGVDIAVRPDFRSFVVLEVNGFGDLLPRLAMGGLDPYGVQIATRLPNRAGRVLHCLGAG